MTAKKPFDSMFERVAGIIDKNYSTQKSTFKGWCAFFKAFSHITKEYSNELHKLSKDGGDHMGLKLPLPECIKIENTTIKAMMGEMLYTVTSMSSLMHNFSERLLEMSEGYSQLYEGVKKTKDHFMEALETNFPKDLLRTIPRENAQKRIAKSMYDMADRLEEDEIERIQKIRENSIILYTVYKKIAEKQQEIVAANATRLGKLQIENSRKDLSKLVNEVAALYNTYPGEPKLQMKNERLVQSVRDSLKLSKRASREIKRQHSQNSLKQIEKNSEGEQQRLLVELNPKYQLRRGLLSKGMNHYYDFAAWVKPQHLAGAVYSLLESYYFGEVLEADIKNNLTGIRVRLRLPQYKPVATRTNSPKEFLQGQFDARPNHQKLAVIQSMLLSMYHTGWGDESQLSQKMRMLAEKRQLSSSDLPTLDFTYDVWVAAAFIDMLLESLFRFKDSSDFLVDNYAEVFRFICKFGREYLQVEPQLSLFLFMERVYRASNFRSEHEIEPNIHELERLIEPNECQAYQLSDLSYYIRGSFRNAMFTKLLRVYEPHTHTSLSVQFLHWIDLYSGTTDSLQSIMDCLRVAGYKYLRSKDPNSLLFGILWENREKIKTLSEAIRDNEYVLIDQKILLPLAEYISRTYSIGQERARKEVRERFFSVILQTILLNLDTIDMQGLEDKQGHLLRIGIELCKIDQLSVQNLSVYQPNFFRLLPAALISMQGQYKDLLQQAKRTEMWITEQNMFATQNCYDFCSLLAKPIEFMVGILKETELSGAERSDFRDRFTMTVKAKLNEIMKSEILKYFSFLDSSLRRIECSEKRVQIECKRIESLPQTKQKQLKDSYDQFKEVCKRLNNLLFVKQQLGDIVKDFLDFETQNRVTNIFDASLLEAEISRVGDTWSGELLRILSKVCREILQNEQKVLYKIAKALVFLYLRRFFDRLYWRAEKGAFDDLFSNSQVKLSEHTLMRHKQELEDYLQLVKRCVPAEYLQQFYETFYHNLYLATKCEILNNTKLRIPLPAEVVFEYLNTDIANISALIKKLSSCPEQTVNRYFYTPVRKLVDMLREDSTVLCGKFQQAYINKRPQQAEQILALLNLRCQQKDRKTKDFVKKYRVSLQP